MPRNVKHLSEPPRPPLADRLGMDSQWETRSCIYKKKKKHPGEM